MGADVKSLIGIVQAHIVAAITAVKGKKIYLDYSVGATRKLPWRKETALESTAQRAEVMDLANFCNSMS